jgi:hypothetical protein
MAPANISLNAAVFSNTCSPSHCDNQKKKERKKNASTFPNTLAERNAEREKLGLNGK